MRIRSIAVCALMMGQIAGAWAESVYAPRQGERLSELMIRHQLLPGSAKNAHGEDLYIPGLVLRRRALQDSQALQKTKLLTLLATMGAGKVPSYLPDLIKALPVTGRQLLRTPDAHEMAAKLPLNPVLQAQDSLVLRTVSPVVALLSNQGVCYAEFKSEVSVPAYLRHCFPKTGLFESKHARDHAWLVQPTGEIIKLNVALWNVGPQIFPQPGAWVWSPARDSEWKHEESENLVRFLQTQGASTDAADNKKMNFLRIGAPPVDGSPDTARLQAQAVRETRSDWGTVGLLQMPSSRMAPAGTVSLTASRVEPYSRYSFIYQPFEWLEAGFRYSIVTNRRFGDASFSGDRKYQDKSVDLKLRLIEESAYIPRLAVGLRDIGGTGLFSSEYFVMNKRAGAFDFTLGLGFGNMATGGGISNPFGFLGEEFDNRPRSTTQFGGQANTDSYFRGQAAVFGGVEWQTPWRDLIFKIELDGNDYSDEPLGNPQRQTSAINYGAVYRINDAIDLSVSMQRGNTMGFTVAFKENVSNYSVPKLNDPKPIVITEGARPADTDWPRTVALVSEQTTWDVGAVRRRGSEIQLTVKNPDLTYPAKAVDKATAALHESVPGDISWFSYVYENRGMVLAEHVVDRKKWSADKTELTIDDGRESTPVVAIEPGNYRHDSLHETQNKWYSGKAGLGYDQTFGGANGYLFQFTAFAQGELELNSQTWLTGRVDQVLGGTFDQFTQRGTSRLPQVRTNFREYAVASDTKLSNLQLNHVGQFSANHFYSVYGGYLESMFGGIGAEYLYRPMNSRWALGLDANRVKQRAFEQDFDFRNYSVNTGHITAYVDTGLEDILATVSVGQYLAGDRGVTVDLSRVFRNGVKIGAYASKTNVSSEDFGEGSFDKGIYLRVPFDALFTKTLPGDASFNWVQVTRDGGAKLRRALSLFEASEIRGSRALWFSPD